MYTNTCELGMRAFKRLNDNESFKRLKKLNVSLNEHGGNGHNCVFNFSLHCLELIVRFLRLNAKRQFYE